MKPLLLLLLLLLLLSLSHTSRLYADTPTPHDALRRHPPSVSSLPTVTFPVVCRCPNGAQRRGRDRFAALSHHSLRQVVSIILSHKPVGEHRKDRRHNSPRSLEHRALLLAEIVGVLLLLLPQRPLYRRLATNGYTFGAHSPALSAWFVQLSSLPTQLRAIRGSRLWFVDHRSCWPRWGAAHKAR